MVLRYALNVANGINSNNYLQCLVYGFVSQAQIYKLKTDIN
jgi:hypothetical protein